MILSKLPKTWIFDLDGVIFTHNGHLNGNDKPIQSFIDFYNRNVTEVDFVIIVSSRAEKYRCHTLEALRLNSIRFNHLILEAPFGERILLNDKKPSGLQTAFSINLRRDSNELECYEIIIKEDL